MINLEFTEEEKNSLYYERFHHPHPRVQLKMEVLWLKSQKIPHKKICQLAGISPNTLLYFARLQLAFFTQGQGQFKSELHHCLIYLYRIPHSGYDSQDIFEDDC
jgi:hypothetical protein